MEAPPTTHVPGMPAGPDLLVQPAACVAESPLSFILSPATSLLVAGEEGMLNRELPLSPHSGDG